MNMRDSNMPPSEAITTLRQLYAAASIYANSAALNYDFRWMRPPDLLEQCRQALAALAQVVSPSEPGVSGSK